MNQQQLRGQNRWERKSQLTALESRQKRREEQKRIEEARRKQLEEEQRINQLQEDINKTISNINEGKITSISQIPESQKQYLDTNQIQNYLLEREQYQKELEKNKRLNSAIQEIAKVGGEEYGNLDSIRDKYGLEVFNEAKNYYYSHRTRETSEPITLAYETPEGYLVSSTPELAPANYKPVIVNAVSGAKLPESTQREFSVELKELEPTKLQPVQEFSLMKPTTLNLNKSGGYLQDVTNVSSGVSDGSSSRFGSAISNFIGSSSDIKKSFQKEQETYIPEFRVFSSVSATGEKGTAIFRPASPLEISQIEQKQAKQMEIIKSPITFLQGEFDWQKKLDEDMRNAKTPKFLEPVVNFFEKDRGKGTLPFGLQEATEFIESPSSKPEITSGEKFNLWLAPQYISAKVTQSGFFEEQVKKRVSEKFPKTATFLESTPPDFLLSLEASLGLGSFFSPAFRIGGTQKQIQKTLSETKFEKLKEALDDLADELKTEEDSPKTQKNILKKFKKDTGLSDENMKKLIEELDRQNILTKDVVTIKEEKGNLFFETTKPKQTGIVVEVPEMKLAGVITGAMVQPSAVRQVNWLGMGTGIKESQVQKQRESQVQRQFLGLGHNLLQKQSQVQKQKQEQKLSSKQILSQLLRTGQTTKQTTKQTTRQTPRQRIKEPEKPTPKIPKPILWKESTKKEVVRKAEEVLKGFEIFSRRFGKEFKIGEAQTPEEAKKILKGYVFSGLARSGKVTRGGEIINLNLGAGFRPAKSLGKGWNVQKNPLQFRSEIKEIQMFKKRTRKKSKKKKFNWF